MRDLLAPEGVATLVVGPLVLAAVGLAVLSAPVIGKSPPDRTAVVDRLGDDYAVLLVEADGEIAEQRVVDPSIVPNGGRYEGAVLDIDGGGYTYNETATDGRERTRSRRFDGLAGRLGDSTPDAPGLGTVRSPVAVDRDSPRGFTASSLGRSGQRLRGKAAPRAVFRITGKPPTMRGEGFEPRSEQRSSLIRIPPAFARGAVSAASLMRGEGFEPTDLYRSGS
jgi:hypothetical protein|nr:DUF3006 domain-containing protein [Natronomonas sp. LN261]